MNVQYINTYIESARGRRRDADPTYVKGKIQNSKFKKGTRKGAMRIRVRIKKKNEHGRNGAAKEEGEGEGGRGKKVSIHHTPHIQRAPKNFFKKEKIERKGKRGKGRKGNVNVNVWGGRKGDEK